MLKFCQVYHIWNIYICFIGNVNCHETLKCFVCIIVTGIVDRVVLEILMNDCKADN